MELPLNYSEHEAEIKWLKYWEENNVYKFNPDTKKEIYTIDTPPPTVSGKMHIGHAFSFSQQDFVARYKRMAGFELFYPFGTDDNGLATERLIEKLKNVKSKKMDRDEFVKLCLKTLEEIRPDFIFDWKKLGMSCDFDIFYSTIDAHSQRISQESFLKLYNSGRIYRKKSPIIFCPHCKTAIAQVEMEDVEKQSTLNYIKAKAESGEYLIYSTTRPELHPACVGISIDENGDYVTAKRENNELWIISKDAYNTMKEEFPMEIINEYKGKELLGKKVEIAYSLRNFVEINHDISVKTEYGTGIVYYCSYGGLDCVEWLSRHKTIEPLHIMDESGVYTKGKYKDLPSDKAREEVLKDLEADGYLIKKQKMKHFVNVHERCQTDIEYVATEQWFIKYLELKEQFLEAGNKLNWYPNHMKNRYDNWVKGLQWDWCISRQRHFGVPIPVWYDKHGNIVVPKADELPIEPLKNVPKGYSMNDLTPEKDVLDTWATSSLTPTLAADLFKNHPVYKKLYPMNLRPQAHDIITFWLFNTLVKSQLHDKINPWKDVMISGWALDPHGKKMSKSKGNVIEPQEVIKKYSADALRFWAAGSKLGEDLPYQEKDLATGKKMVTKLWNASKLAITNLEDYKGQKPKHLLPIDAWILSKLNNLIKSSTESFEKYEYSKTKQEVEKFFFSTLCDNYLEIIKERLYNPDIHGVDAKVSAQYTLHTSFFSVLKLMAPIMPFITEEIYHLHFIKTEGLKSIHHSEWPKFNAELINEEAEKIGDMAVDIISIVRKFKSTNKISLKEEISTLILAVNEEDEKLLKKAIADIKGVTRAKEIIFDDKDDDSFTRCENFDVKVGIIK